MSTALKQPELLRCHTLRAYVRACRWAAEFRADGRPESALEVIRSARSAVFVQLSRRWGLARVLKRAHVIQAVLERAESRQAPDLFGVEDL